MRIGNYKPGMYEGLSYSVASRKAQDICKIAGETGETILAAEHLSELAKIMKTMLKAA